MQMAKTNQEDLTGERFGRLTVVFKNYRAWMCDCDCGYIASFTAKQLLGGKKTSCGTCDGRVKHGMTGSPEYTAWTAMRQRGRGYQPISPEDKGHTEPKVCARWSDFANFYADMGRRIDPDHSVELIDPNGLYEPGNAVWAVRGSRRVGR
jgi:hypothetical protein